MKKQRPSPGKKSGPSKKPASGGFTFKDRSGKEHFTRGQGDKTARDQGGKSVRPSGPAPKPLQIQKNQKQVRRDAPPHRRDGSGPRRDVSSPKKKHHESASRVQPGARSVRASIDKNQKGFAFLVFGSKDVEDVYLSPRNATSFLHGDRVEVIYSKKGEIEDVKLVEHRFKELVGRFSPSLGAKKRTGYVIYERKRAREEIFIPEPPHNLKPGDWVRVQLQFHSSPSKHQSPNVTGKVLEIYGPELPASSDVQTIAAEFNLIDEHPPQCVQEAKSFTLEVPGKDLQGREDLRNIPFITIDGETARDFDDAVYVEKDGSAYILWVAIADVSHYVREGTALNKDARSRGTSVYFPERAYHMLPRALSEELCSLKPNVPRLTLVAKMKYQPNGTRETIELYEAVIQSRRRATYNEISAEHSHHRNDPKWEYQPHFELYEILREMREKRGSIDFDLPETQIMVDDKGEPTEVKKRERLDAHRLIEEFMIAANESVTEWALKKKWPFIYRTHDIPSGESLERFRNIARTVGFTFELEEENVQPGELAEIARKMQGHPAQLLLNNQLLRSMRQAIYSSTHGIHFGLASKAYTHFTSPIRRYPDLVVHRMLRWALRSEKDHSLRLKNQERETLESELEEIAEHCSYRERLATEAERESIRLKQVRLLKKHLGKEFDATIIGMMDRGLFAQLDDPFVEGLIPKESMQDDFYEFNEERMIFYGKRKRRTFKVGERIRIQVVRADIEKRQADFALIDSPSST